MHFTYLLDLSVAFDTTDHKMLTQWLQNVLAIKVTALQWFES